MGRVEEQGSEVAAKALMMLPNTWLISNGDTRLFKIIHTQVLAKQWPPNILDRLRKKTM
jgi:hypothetical protein